MHMLRGATHPEFNLVGAMKSGTPAPRPGVRAELSTDRDAECWLRATLLRRLSENISVDLSRNRYDRVVRRVTVDAGQRQQECGSRARKATPRVLPPPGFSCTFPRES